MPALLSNFFILFFTFVDIFAFYRLLNHKLSYRFPHRFLIPTYVVSYIFGLLCSYTTKLFPDFPLKILLVLLLFISLLLMYKDAAFRKIFWIVAAFFVLIACELLAIPFILMLMRANLHNIAENPVIQVLGTLLSRFFLLAAVELLIHTGKKIFDSFSKDFFLIILTDIVYVFMIVSLFYFDNIYITHDAAIAMSLSAIITITVLALCLLRKIAIKSEEILNTNLKLQQIEMEHKQNQDMAIVVEDLRTLRHDMNNHVSVLQGLLVMEEYEDAKAYLSTITKDLAVANSFIFIDNKVLSVLINNKISKARKLGIAFDAEIMAHTTPFSDSNLCAVVGNMIDNAIEAASGHNRPYIYFSMKKMDHQLLIQCENTYSVPPIFRKGELITTKSDPAYHGIGTKTIRSIIENYHGTTEFTADELFHINISVPL